MSHILSQNDGFCDSENVFIGKTTQKKKHFSIIVQRKKDLGRRSVFYLYYCCCTGVPNPIIPCYTGIYGTIITFIAEGVCIAPDEILETQKARRAEEDQQRHSQVIFLKIGCLPQFTFLKTKSSQQNCI